MRVSYQFDHYIIIMTKSLIISTVIVFIIIMTYCKFLFLIFHIYDLYVNIFNYGLVSYYFNFV